MVGKMTRPLEKKHILCAIKSMAVNPEKIFWINVRGHLLICLFFPATVYNWVAIRGTYILLYVSQGVKKIHVIWVSVCLFLCFAFISLAFPFSFQNVFDIINIHHGISFQCLWYFFNNPPLLLLQRIKTKGS